MSIRTRIMRGLVTLSIVSFLCVSGYRIAYDFFHSQPADTLVLPTVAALPSATATPNVVEYQVAEGDTLYNIAATHALPLETIVAVNNLEDGNAIFAGQVLNIPVQEVTAAAVVRPTLPPTWTWTPSDTPSVTPTVTATHTPTITQTVTPSPTPEERGVVLASSSAQASIYPQPVPARARMVNGYSVEQFVVMPNSVIANSREVFRRGQFYGNNPRAFSKVGDCNSQAPHYLTRFDGVDYNLGSYDYLQPTIDYFDGSYQREGVAVWLGNHAWSVITSAWADNALCNPNESALACEYRLNNPSVVIVRLGTNEFGYPKGFEDAMRTIIEETLAEGIVPILGTKADQRDGPGDPNNTIIRALAAEYQVPLWDFALVARNAPGSVLDLDNVHLTTYYAHDYTDARAFERGHGIQNLTALMALERVWQAVILPELAATAFDS